MRIGIICSKSFDKISDIRRLMSKIKNDLGLHNCIIVSAAHSNGDLEVKRQALKHELAYLEYNPAYTGKNMFSAEDLKYYEGKNWHFSQIIHRYQRLFFNVNKLFIFKKQKDTDEILDMVTKKIPKKLKHSILIS